MHMNMKFIPVPLDNSDKKCDLSELQFFGPDGRAKLKVEPRLPIPAGPAEESLHERSLRAPATGTQWKQSGPAAV